MNRKFRKLLRDPKLFFADMYIKRSAQFKKYLPLKYTGNYQYTVVSAVYNVEKYLDDYFDSLTKQSLNFKKHIHIILVDDGSTDNSAEIIRKWQEKFPNNIRYYYKENGGQASARNFGLDYVETEWLTFIDPDDFVSSDYFLDADNTLQKEKDVSILATSIAVYKEDRDSYHYDTAPLAYCFKDKDKKVPINNLKNKIQLSVCTAFFKTEIVKSNKLSFDEKVKPCFEDGLFIADYFIKNDTSYIYFLDKAYYFYRVREDNSSTTNTQWQKKEKYIDVFEYGYLQMFKKYIDKYNKVPLNIQMTFLFFAIQYIKLIVQKGEQVINFLSPEEKQKFLSLFFECFKFIDKNTIMQFHLHGCNFFYKSGMLNSFKKESPNFIMVYLEKINYQKELLELYFYGVDDCMDYIIDGIHTLPALRKIKEYKFMNSTFINEHRIWISIEKHNKVLELKASVPVKIVYNKKEYINKIPLEAIQPEPNKHIHSGPWLFIDKETKADDNAEHLYRYMLTHYPEQEAYFVLNKSSSDWNRLAAEDFKLIEFGSKKFEEKLRLSTVLFSSHADRYFMDYFGKDTLKGKKFVFLQHGVIMHDLSAWLNHVSKISLFCTSTRPEYNFIGGSNSPYKYSHEVKLTGLARHDALLEKSKKYASEKNILIMPTWRNHIVGSLKQGSVSREINPNFTQTDYFKYWHTFLHSNELKAISEKYGYSITFIPHPNISDYLDLFEIPDYIEYPNKNRDISIQNSMAKASIMITDYSSISFDMAFLQKATLYYQFDADDFFSGNHTSSQGYFSYEKDGFGPVAYTQEMLINNLHALLQNNCAAQEPYASRIQHTYPQNDGKNCERIYQAVINLDQPEYPSNQVKLKDLIAKAESFHAWEVAASRIAMFLQDGSLPQDEKASYENRYLNALFMDNKFVELMAYLETNATASADKDYWTAKVNLQIGNPRQAFRFFIEQNKGTAEDRLTALLVAAYFGHDNQCRALTDSLQSYPLTENGRQIIGLAKEVCRRNHFVALAMIGLISDKMNLHEKRLFKLDLLAAYLNMDTNNLDAAHNCLVRYEKYRRNDPACRIAIARLAKFKQNNGKFFDQLNKAFQANLLLIPEDLVPLYLKHLHELGNLNGVHYLHNRFMEKYPKNRAIRNYRSV